MNEVIINNRNGVIDVQVSEKVALAIRTLQQKQIAIQEAKNEEEELKDLFMGAMKKANVTSIDYDGIKIQYKAPHYRTAIDSKRLKADLPEVAEKYSKTSPVKESIVITYD